MLDMVIDMNDSQLNSLADLSAFVMGTAPVQFALVANERYAFIEGTLRRFGYVRLRRVDKAVHTGSRLPFCIRGHAYACGVTSSVLHHLSSPPSFSLSGSR